MRKLVALVTMIAFASAGAGCGRKKSAATGAGSGSGSGVVADGSGATAVASVPDAERDAVVRSAADLRGLFRRAGDAADRMGKAIDAIEAAGKTVARDAWDPAAVVEKVGADRLALFSWVRDNTALVPYRGSLRGAVGVLMDRVGNSLDRALLLAALLARVGLEVRLANAQLDPTAVDALAAAWSTRPRPAVPGAAFAPAALEPIAAAFGLDPKGVATASAAAEAARAALAKRTATRIAQQIATLSAVIPPAPAGDADADRTAALADHWWVQVHDGEAWSDLDPSRPDASPGEPVATVASETIAVDDLGDDRRHTLTIRVVGEVWHGPTREQVTLVEHTFAPSQFYGQRVTITNVPFDADQAAITAAADPVAALRTALVAQTEWIPVIVVGTTPVAGNSVNDAGDLVNMMDPHANTTRLAQAVQRATRRDVGAASDLLGTLPTGDDVPPPPAPPAEHSGFTAEWIELETRAPGGPASIARRVVFDAQPAAGLDRATAAPMLLSESQRLERGLGLVGEVEVLPMFARIPEAFVVDRLAKGVVAARPVLVQLAALGGAAPSPELREQLAALPGLPGPLYGLALGRFAWSSVGERVYLDRLGVLVERRDLVTAGAALRPRRGFDIAANHVAVWPGADARATRIAQGVAETAVESALVECGGAGAECVRTHNASDDLAAAPAAALAVAAAGSAADALPLAPTARALAGADLAAGYAVITQAGPARTTWWRVDPRTGELLGMSPLGGSVSAEALRIISFEISMYNCVYTIADAADHVGAGIVCGASAAFGLLGGLGAALAPVAGSVTFYNYVTLAGLLLSMARFSPEPP
jgi:hypothetical protein